MMDRFMSLVGLVAFVAIAWSLSRNRQIVSWRVVFWGILLQLALGFLALGIPALGVEGLLRGFFLAANDGVVAILNFTLEGSRFIFGPLVDESKMGFIFAVQVLPTIIFMASLMAIFYHLGIMQKVVRAIAILMQKFMGTSGAESLSAAANVFVGQTEAPLVIRPFVARMTQSELFAVMVGGMASVAGGVLAAYTGLLKDQIPNIAGHLITASLMSAPASLAIAKLMHPESERPDTLGQIPEDTADTGHANVIEAAASGASDGLMLAMNVLAMLLAFTALIALFNGLLAWLGGILGWSSSEPLSFQLILGYLFSPLAWLMGIPWQECVKAGSLLGQKTVLNEFVAYLDLAKQSAEFSERTRIILSYALCGFANFSSIAIQIGGIGGIAPERKRDLAQLGIRSVIGGTLAAFMTAAIAGLLI